jgi:hypothetical protein
MKQSINQSIEINYYFVLQGIENSNARALVVKGINVLLTLLQVRQTEYCQQPIL